MDRYNYITAKNTQEEEDEPFYFPPPCSDKDLVCPGSDDEQTPEEIHEKHLRYEYHARRYLRGHLPVLQSAGLRGPFSGWVNPWAVKTIREDEWWQPGSENMLFTRENVMRRAANHGLGYLKPADALAWCKASAQEEAQYIDDDLLEGMEADNQLEVENTLGDLEPNETPEEAPTKDEPSNFNPDPKSSGKQSMVNHYNDTPRTDEAYNDSMRGMKRPVDQQWLKRPFTYKRARWDGPAISTPTPFPEMGERQPRRHQSVSKGRGSNTTRPNGYSHLSMEFSGLQPDRQMETALELETPPISSLSQGPTSGTSTRNSLYRGLSLGSGGSVLQLQDEDIGDLHKSDESIPMSVPRGRSRRKSRQSSQRIADASRNHLELGNPNARTPRQPSLLGYPNSGSLQHTGASSSNSYQLPEAPWNPSAAAETPSYNVQDDYSFITEVAPSSRNLEKFEYKKKHKRKSSGNIELDPNIPDRVWTGQYTLGRLSESKQNDEKENSPEHIHQVEIVENQGPVLVIDEVMPNRKKTLQRRKRVNVAQAQALWEAFQPRSSSKTSEYTELSEARNQRGKPEEAVGVPTVHEESRETINNPDDTWDLMEDIVQQPAGFVGGGSAGDFTPKQQSVTAGNSFSLVISQNIEIETGLGSQNSKRSSRPSRSRTSTSSAAQTFRHSSRPSTQNPKHSMRSSQPHPVQSLPKRMVEHPSYLYSQNSMYSLRSSQLYQSQSLPEAKEKTPGQPVDQRKHVIHQDLNDMSTQSYNTSPLKRAVNGPSDILTKATSYETQQEVTPSEEIPHYMECVAKTLSQHCLGPVAAIASHIDVNEGPENRNQKDSKARSAHELPPARNHAPASSGPGPTSQTPVEDVEMNMEGEVDAAPEPAVVREPQGTPHTGRRPSQSTLDSKMAGTNSGANMVAGTCALSSAKTEATSCEFANRAGGDPTEPADDIAREDASLIVTGSPKKGLIDSESSWQGCGPQSPWTAEMQPISITHSGNPVQGGEAVAGPSTIDSPSQGDGSTQQSFHSEERDWHHMGRAQTPARQGTKPLTDLTGTSLTTEVTITHLDDKGLPSTQLLVDAATSNPWTNNFRNPSSKKSKKRVSFGVLQSEEKENSQPQSVDSLDFIKSRHGSPPPPQHNYDDDIFGDNTATGDAFGRHFTATKQFQYLHPHNQGSPLHSSPAFGAQAEAFIAADREASVEQRRPSISPRSPSRRVKIRADRGKDDSWSKHIPLNSFQSSQESTAPQNPLENFDMEDALATASEFLEDWSVDAELRRTREPEASSRRESNGKKRRVLFGLF